MWIQVWPGERSIRSPCCEMKTNGSNHVARYQVPSCRRPSRNIVARPVPVSRMSRLNAPPASSCTVVVMMSVLMMTMFLAAIATLFAASTSRTKDTPLLW
jgi:hypothetical protein